MKRSILLALLAVCCATGAVWAQAPADPAAAPRIEFASLAHDFGHAVSGARLEKTFTFRNAGSSALLIQSVKGG